MRTPTLWSKAFTSLLCGLLAIGAFAPLTVFSAKLEVPFENYGDNPSKLDDIVQDQDWLLVLGRAFFWDQQMGSDGGSCASCHFSAGADNRLTGQLNPAFRAPGGGDTEFGCVEGSDCETNPGTTGSGGIAGPEYTFIEEDFPFRQFIDDENGNMIIDDRNAPLRINTNDVLSSAGSFDAHFISSFYGEEKCGKASSDIFYKTTRHGRLAKRAVEPRNTPSVINTGMFQRNFWDVRANSMFNGVGVFGMSDILHDPNKRLIQFEDGEASLTYLTLENASLASLSVGPILDNLEMSCEGRTFADVARKILYTRPLYKQRIAKTDSTFGIHGPFGDLRDKRGRGLHDDLRYYNLIKMAFKPKWWKAKGLWKIENGELIKLGKYSYEDGYAQMEINFPMFWGLAVQKYQHSLISDQSRWDIADNAGCFDAPPSPIGQPPNTPPLVAECIKPVSEGGLGLWSEAEERGRVLFNGVAGCAACHGGDMFSTAAMDNDGNMAEMLLLGFGPPNAPLILAEGGVFNTGANVLAQDLGAYATDAYGIPLSYTMQLATGNVVDKHADICNIVPVGPNSAPLGPICAPDGTVLRPIDWSTQRVEVGGAMKSPSLRNTALTPPYFHYGGYASLSQVMDFYARGGSARDIPEGCTQPGPGNPNPANPCTGDTSGSGPLGQTPFEDIGKNGAPHGSNVAGAIAAGSAGMRALAASGAPFSSIEQQKADMVEFMKSLTDPRVQCDAGVFDHPELVLFTGSKARDRNRDGRADDKKVRIPAVGIEGYAHRRPELCLPNAGDLFEPAMGNRIKDGRKKASTQ